MLTLSPRQYEQSHLEAKQRCATYEDYLQGFEVAIGHVNKRAAEEAGVFSMVRRNLGPRDIAAVILQGQLNYDRCETKPGFKKIAIEAVFGELIVSDETGKQSTFTNVQVRVVVKDLISGGKMIVVSYYKLYSDQEKEGLPEVNYEKIWV